MVGEVRPDDENHGGERFADYRGSRRLQQRTLASTDGPIVAAVIVGLGLTVFVTFNPVVRAYDNVALHVALETGEGLIAALLAFLALSRFRAEGLTRDALLAVTFAVLAATNLVLSAVPLVALDARPVGTLTWTVVGLRLLGALGVCSAALVGAASRVARRLQRRLLVAVVLSVVAAVAASAGAAAWLSDAVDPALSPESSGRPKLVGHPVVLSFQLVGMALYAAAAVGFRRQGRGSMDPLVPWLAGGAALAAFARLNFFLFPSLYSNWVYTGDVLRLGSYLVFLVGAARQIDAYRHDQTLLAILRERRRIARELHDGLIQELAFIRSQCAALASGVPLPGVAVHLAAAADRALAEARQAVQVFSEGDLEPFAVALQRTAEEVATRAGTHVRWNISGVPELPVPLRVELLRVVREAVTNAVRHGQAKLVTIGMAVERMSLRLTVSDDGTGFDTSRSTPGFGLRSMRDRVHGHGGSLVIESRPDAGTIVELVIPIPIGAVQRRRWLGRRSLPREAG